MVNKTRSAHDKGKTIRANIYPAKITSAFVSKDIRFNDISQKIANAV